MKPGKFIQALCAIVICQGVTSAANAGLIAVESGDFSDSLSPSSQNVGQVAFGTNTISGSLAGNCIFDPSFNWNDCNPASGGGDAQDSLLFDLGAGLEVTDVFLTVSNIVAPDGFQLSASSQGFGFGADDFFASFPATTSTTVGDLLQLSGIFMSVVGDVVGLSVFGGIADQEGAYALDWQFAVFVRETPIAQLPAPGAFLPIAAGLVGIGWLRRRKGLAAGQR